jgi:3D (Asp-Asp-Asp) domain-containing protein
MRALALVPLSFLLCSCDEIKETHNQIRLVRVSDVQAVHVHPLRGDNGLKVISVSGPVIKEVLRPKPTERLITVEVTAYCPCARCCGKMTGKTSTKSNAWKPGIAAFPGALPYGTLVSVPGYERAEWATVDDTGGDMRKAWKNHGKILLDMRMVYHWEAKQWGRQTLTVKVKDM